MTEPKRATTLDDIGTVEILEPVERPDGQTVNVPLRSLPSEEMRKIRASIKWPEPPVTDFKTIDGKKGIPIYNYQDDGYKKATDDATHTLALRMILASLLIEIPGETEDEKFESLKSKLGQYALESLTTAISAINHLSEEAVAKRARSFRRQRLADAPGNGTAQFDPQPMVLAEPG